MKRYRARLLPSAYNDIRTARSWYRQHNKDLPKRFTLEVTAAIERVCTHPFAYAVRYNEVHIANLNIFPYAVHYLVEEATNSIMIIAVHHTAISPAKWEKRAE